jgi:hypothetical protein
MSKPIQDEERARIVDSQEFALRMKDDFGAFGIVPIEADSRTDRKSTADLRRQRKKRFDDKTGIMTLIDDDGVLHWEIGSGPVPQRRPGRRGMRRGGTTSGRVVERFTFADLPPNAIGRKLDELDAHLTRRFGLFEVPKAALDTLLSKDPAVRGQQIPFVGPIAPPQDGRVLLFVHGTFSNCENLLRELASTGPGAELLRDMFNGGQYRKVMAFNHPTLGVSPVLNAVALAQKFRGSNAQVDVICHSRGGLVTRWWLEVTDPYQVLKHGNGTARGRVVLVGSPLAGTGLASPHQLKGALGVLTNVSKTLGKVAQATGVLFPLAAPMGHAAGVLFSLFGKVTAFAAKTPLLDAGVAMIPGLSGQSRVGSNGEILQLRSAFANLPQHERQQRYLDQYWFVQSNFETEEAGWKFWKYFRRDKLADIATNQVFEGENDLVVDTSSMVDLADELRIEHLSNAYRKDHVVEFGTNATVHHCNYFQQPRTVAAIRTAFQV